VIYAHVFKTLSLKTSCQANLIENCPDYNQKELKLTKYIREDTRLSKSSKKINRIIIYE